MLTKDQPFLENVPYGSKADNESALAFKYRLPSPKRRVAVLIPRPDAGGGRVYELNESELGASIEPQIPTHVFLVVTSADLPDLTVETIQ